MKEESITRKNIIDALITTLEPLDYVNALWEGGAAGFNRVDKWSDLDLHVDVADEHVEDTFESIEKAILTLSEIELKFRLPEPTWHGHSQAFYRLKNASPFLFLDIVVLKQSTKDKFLQFKIHGKPIAHIDKTGVVKNDPPDQESFLNKIGKRLESLKNTFPLFQALTLKELNRGNDITAFGFYMQFTYRPLVEVLRIKYYPLHFNFYTSYVHYDLPPEVVKHLHSLCFVANSEDLRKYQAEADAWFWEVVESISFDEVKRKIT